MLINKTILDNLTEQAKQTERLRMNYDLRTSSADQSQRMLNALEPGTVLPIHRHMKSTETVVLLRGKVRQNYYEEEGQETWDQGLGTGDHGQRALKLVESRVIAVGDPCPMYVVPVGMWHNTECLESGTIIFEAKDGAYEPARPEDFWKEK